MPKPIQPRYGDFVFIICVFVENGVLVENSVLVELIMHHQKLIPMYFNIIIVIFYCYVLVFRHEL
jgi:hypothetical protein